MPQTLLAEIERLASAAGLDALGVAGADDFNATLATIVERKERGLHGGMHFTYGRPERSTSPRRLMAGSRCLVVGARSYHRPEPEAPRAGEARVGAYQWDDHYGALRAALDVVADHLRSHGHEAIVLVDDNRLVDRAAAHRAGLGWFGKNTNLLLEGRGSWFVLGSVLTDADLPVAQVPVADGCGPCTACVSACPTGALDIPGELDARRCLAWLVQADGVFPRRLRVALGDRIYGCDDCQTVCPPNRLQVRRRNDGRARIEPEGAVDRSRAVVDVVDMLLLDDAALMARFGHWYVPRRRPEYLRRNALVVLGNVGDPDDPRVDEVLLRHLADQPIVAAHAVWAARRLGRDELLAHLPDTDDELIRSELAGAVPRRSGAAA